MPFRAVLPVLALAAVLAGCGTTGGSSSSASKDFDAQQQQVADKIGDLASAGRRRKPADICDDILSSALRAKVSAPGSDCRAEMKKALEDADGFDLDVRDVKVSGSTATATVRSTSGKRDVTRTLRLTRESGGWRITSFG